MESWTSDCLVRSGLIRFRSGLDLQAPPPFEHSEQDRHCCATRRKQQLFCFQTGVFLFTRAVVCHVEELNNEQSDGINVLHLGFCLLNQLSSLFALRVFMQRRRQKSEGEFLFFFLGVFLSPFRRDTFVCSLWWISSLMKGNNVPHEGEMCSISRQIPPSEQNLKEETYPGGGEKAKASFPQRRHEWRTHRRLFNDRFGRNCWTSYDLRRCCCSIAMTARKIESKCNYIEKKGTEMSLQIEKEMTICPFKQAICCFTFSYSLRFFICTLVWIVVSHFHIIISDILCTYKKNGHITHTLRSLILWIWTWVEQPNITNHPKIKPKTNKMNL